MKPGVGEVVYHYTPNDWDQERFLALGGFVIVFLNYNKKDFLEKSAASALKQDFALCEIFLMDDASPDGSGVLLEEIARRYCGPHKVTVVRNAVNQHICGQWNIVSRLATGTWFGMFCGDDIALSDRVSKAAEIISANPSLLGFATGGFRVDMLTGEQSYLKDFVRAKRYDSGTMDLWGLALKDCPCFGATSFYHRNLFDHKFPLAPYDDVLLRWVVQMKAYGNPEPCWLWAGDVETITYYFGCGITTEHNRGGARRSIGKRVDALAGIRRFSKRSMETWGGVRQYAESVGAPQIFVEISTQRALEAALWSCGTLGRLRLLPSVIRHFVTSKLPLCVRKRVALIWARQIVVELFGLHISSAVVIVLKRIMNKA